jgi:hypothetical protein
MAVYLWVPDPALAADSAADHRFLLCVQTSDLLYILVDGPPPTPSWSPDDRVPLWFVAARTAEGVLPFVSGGGTGSGSGVARPLIIAVYGAPGPSVESIALELKDDATPVLTARAVRLSGPLAVSGVTVWMTDPPPPDPLSSLLTDLDGVLLVDGERDYRTLLGVETAEALYILMEGPTGRLPLPWGRWAARVSSSAGELACTLFSFGGRKRAPAYGCSVFELPPPGVDALEVELLRDSDVLMRAALVRSASDRPARQR